MTDNDIIKAFQDLIRYIDDSYTINLIYGGKQDIQTERNEDIIEQQQETINRQKEEIEKQNKEIKDLNTIRSRLIESGGTLTKISDDLYKKIKAEAVKEFAERIDALLSRYSHLHKHADEARRITDEYSDGTPMEMVSVWEVVSLERFGLVDYETMTTLQDNIETIAKERLLTEFEKDLRLLSKEMAGE